MHEGFMRLAAGPALRESQQALPTSQPKTPFVNLLLASLEIVHETAICASEAGLYQTLSKARWEISSTPGSACKIKARLVHLSARLFSLHLALHNVCIAQHYPDATQSVEACARLRQVRPPTQISCEGYNRTEQHCSCPRGAGG